MKLIWTCSWDGQPCEYETVNVKDGKIVKAPHGVAKHWGIYAPDSWDRCVMCPHSKSIGTSYPRLSIENDDETITRI